MNFQTIATSAIEFLYCLMDITLLYYFCSIFLTPKPINKIYSILLFLITALLIYGITSNPVYSTYGTFLSLLPIVLYVILRFPGSRKLKISIGLLYHMITGVVSLLTVNLTTMITPITSEDILVNPVLRFLVVFLTKLLIFLVCYLIQNKRKRVASNSQNIKSLLVFVVSVLFVLIFLFEFVFLTNKVDTQILITVMSVVFIISVAIIGIIIAKYYESKETNSVLAMRLHEASLKNRLYIQNKNQQIEIMKIKHDISNHLIVIENYITQNKNDEALQYLSTLHHYPGLRTYVHTHNDTLNAILNQKISEYPDLNFKVRHDEGLYEIQSDKLTIILGNALDNAIEATQLFDTFKPEIKVTISENKYFIKLYVSNSFSKAPIIEKDSLVSQKNDEFSGYGMMNIYEAAKSISGDVKYSIKNNVFELTVLIEKIPSNQKNDNINRFQ